MTVFHLMMNGIFVSCHISLEFAMKAKAAYDAKEGLDDHESYIAQRVLATSGTKPYASSKIVG